MVITINEKDIELNFGIRFVRELDEKHHTVLNNGIKIGMGLQETVPLLIAGDAVTLSEVIYTATCKAEKRPSQADIDDYIDAAEDIEALTASVLEELKNANATKRQAAEMVAETTAAMKIALQTSGKATKRSTKA